MHKWYQLSREIIRLVMLEGIGTPFCRSADGYHCHLEREFDQGTLA
jgi:hypothetical protein